MINPFHCVEKYLYVCQLMQLDLNWTLLKYYISFLFKGHFKIRNIEHSLLKSVGSYAKEMLGKYLKRKIKCVYWLFKSFKGKKIKKCSNFNEDKWIGEEAFMGRWCWQMGVLCDYYVHISSDNMQPVMLYVNRRKYLGKLYKSNSNVNI